MTLMLASVSNPSETEIALAEGADIIDLKDPSKGAFGAVDLSTLRSTLGRVAGRRRVSAACGDLPMDPRVLVEAATALAATGVDFVELGLFPSDRTAACIAALQPVAARTKLIAVCFADIGADFAWLPLLGEAGFAGAMLDTAVKAKLRLIDYMNISELDRFVQVCRSNKLMTGLAGALEAPDVARLLLLAPDFLGFRGALCAGKSRAATILPSNVRIIRDLIPRADAPRDLADDVKVDWRFLAARNYSVEKEAKPATDRVFVHDFVLPVSIGAYNFERDITQKVRFNIDVEVKRTGRQAEDMRDVFSYDVIVDAIRLILSRGHVALVETLAEQIADALLAHPRVIAVTIRVEKLDVVEGCVGVELTRERAAQGVATQRRIAPLSEISAVKTGV
ncbi:MAG: (5-formylfuran-3-yl)methyl phosphate synthase [Beijerinckiaceae bacterium]